MTEPPTAMPAHPPLTGLLEKLELPRGEILFIHVRLKGLPGASGEDGYRRTSRLLVEELDRLYAPRAILVPTFTYGFTDSRVYDRVRTPGEVGRFGEEVRRLHPYERRTMNPVFSVMDPTGFTDRWRLREDTAFGPGSLLDHLAREGHIVVNIHTPELISTYLHYLEAAFAVDYRFAKRFPGRVSPDGRTFRQVDYEYYVRDLDLDTRWRRDKILSFLRERGGLHLRDDPVRMHWFSSRDADRLIGGRLTADPRFLITD